MTIQGLTHCLKIILILSVASSLLVWGYSAVLAYHGQTTSFWAKLGAEEVYALGWLVLGVGLWCLPVYMILRKINAQKGV